MVIDSWIVCSFESRKVGDTNSAFTVLSVVSCQTKNQNALSIVVIFEQKAP